MRKCIIFILLVLFSVLMACNNSGSGGGSTPEGDLDLNSGIEGENTGTVMLSLTDAPNFELESVFVTIDEVKVCKAIADPEEEAEMNDEDEEDCEWMSLMSTKGTYDLLTLTNGVTQTLAIEELPPGIYNQMRLMIGETPDNSDNHPHANYLYLKGDDNPYELKIPSGVQSGIKLVHSFEVLAGRFKELILDFDAKKSVVQAGKSGQYILQPTIKVIDVENLAKVSGIVTDDTLEATPIEGASVYAFTGDIEASAQPTDSNGYYELFLENDEWYTLLAAAPGFESFCHEEEIFTENGLEYSVDFKLNPVEATREVQLIVTADPAILPDGTDAIGIDEFTVSFKDVIDCGDDRSLEMEVLSMSFAEAISFPVPGYHTYVPDTPIILPSGIDTEQFRDYILTITATGNYLSTLDPGIMIPFEFIFEQNMNLFGGLGPHSETITLSNP